MTEATGTVKGWASLKTKCIVAGIRPNTTSGGTTVELRPEYDDTIREHQLVDKSEGHGAALLRMEISNPEATKFFELNKPVYLEITRA